MVSGAGGAGVPRLLVLTDRHQAAAAGRTVTATIAAAVRGGARAVVLREKDLPAGERLAAARALRDVLDPVGGALIVASDAGVARRSGASGVHLARGENPPAGTDLLCGRSCHDAAELAAAARLRLDYVTLSPVYATSSKPGYGPALTPFGPVPPDPPSRTPEAAPPVEAAGGVPPGRARAGGMAGLVAGTPGCPRVFALGGITPERVADCLAAGAYGVAVMGGIMGAADPERVVRNLSAALREGNGPFHPRPDEARRNPPR